MKLKDLIKLTVGKIEITEEFHTKECYCEFNEWCNSVELDMCEKFESNGDWLNYEHCCGCKHQEPKDRIHWIKVYSGKADETPFKYSDCKVLEIHPIISYKSKRKNDFTSACGITILSEY